MADQTSYVLFEEAKMKSKMYDVILADPPWTFRVWNKDTGNGRSAISHYPVMTIEELEKIELPTEKNCALFIWVCWPTLIDSLRLIKSWGFEYKTIAWVWVKQNKSGRGFFTGMGYYTRANTEPCILATKGTMPVSANDVQALIVSSVREHSRKPDEQYEKIERLYPNKKYLELFARHKRKGWSSWGNEISCDVEIKSSQDKSYQKKGTLK
jgi:N6-adenosine-specific RNA methylase IME4